MNSHNAYPDEDPLPSGRPESGTGAGTDSGSPSGTGSTPDSTPGADFPGGPPPLYPNAQLPGAGFPGGQAPGAHSADTRYAYPQSQPQNFFNWVRSHGIQRGQDRWIGGVASGIAHRLGVDPLIVRGVFIVLSIFAGIGVLLYGIAWALLPEPDGRIHVQEAGAGRWTTGMTGALITTVIGFPSLGSGFWGWERNGFGGFFWTVFWIAGAVYLIYYLSQRDKASNGAPLMNTSTDAGSAAGGTFTATSPAGTSSPAPGGSYEPGSYTGAPYSGAPFTGGPYDGGVPGSGGYGATPPYGGGYGGPSKPAPKAPNVGPGAPAVAVTAGVALLVGGGIKALEALNVINLGDATNAVVWASGAAILGLGILIAGLRGRTSGILGFFAVVALIIGGIFNVVPNGDRFRFQDANWNPVSIEQAREGFNITGGSGTADLTRLNLTPPLGTDVVIPMDVTASNLTVVIPDTVPVEIRADMTLGNLNEGSQNHGGMTSQQSNYNTDKPGAALILKIDGTMSNITIQEGN
jgi:phage shock protein PspC (stress-responsive transcriptional regulator)